MEEISWSDFERVEMRVGTIVSVEEFPEARKPAYQLTVDFGEFGIRRSSAQITALYRKEELIGRQVLGVLNFPSKKIAGFTSQVLVTGVPAADGAVVLLQPERAVPNGARLF